MVTVEPLNNGHTWDLVYIQRGCPFSIAVLKAEVKKIVILGVVLYWEVCPLSEVSFIWKFHCTYLLFSSHKLLRVLS